LAQEQNENMIMLSLGTETRWEHDYAT